MATVYYCYMYVVIFPFQVALGNDKSNLASIVCFYLPIELISHFAKVVLKQIWNTNRELTDNQSNRLTSTDGDCCKTGIFLPF